MTETKSEENESSKSQNGLGKGNSKRVGSNYQNPTAEDDISTGEEEAPASQEIETAGQTPSKPLRTKKELISAFETINRIIKKVETHKNGPLEIPLVDAPWIIQLIKVFYCPSLEGYQLDGAHIAVNPHVIGWEFEYAVEDQEPILLCPLQLSVLRKTLECVPRNVVRFATQPNDLAGSKWRVMTLNEVKDTDFDDAKLRNLIVPIKNNEVCLLENLVQKLIPPTTQVSHRRKDQPKGDIRILKEQVIQLCYLTLSFMQMRENLKTVLEVGDDVNYSWDSLTELFSTRLKDKEKMIDMLQASRSMDKKIEDEKDKTIAALRKSLADEKKKTGEQAAALEFNGGILNTEREEGNKLEREKIDANRKIRTLEKQLGQGKSK